jgi:flavin-dependent dehydrogenase
MLMARAGLRVLVIDRAGYGTDTISTHALMRGGVLQLHRWGVLPHLQEMGTPAVRETTFHYGDEEVTVAIRPANGVEALYAPRRTLLDRTLVDAARNSGAVVRHGCSLVGRLAGAQTVREGHHATAVVFGYFRGIDLKGSHWWFRPGVSAGAIPTNRGRHCIFAAMPPTRLRGGADRTATFRMVLREADPALAASIADSEPDEPLCVFAGRKGFLRQAFGPGWALVGDAGYFKDPLTAHGITDALRDAELLANAATTGTEAGFADYAMTRDALSMPLFEVSDAIAALDWDLDQIKSLHQTLNVAMKREVEHVLSLGEGAATVPSGKFIKLEEEVV